MVALATDPVKERREACMAEVADILATGLLRRRRTHACSVPGTCSPLEKRRFSDCNLLEVTAKTSPDVAAN
jgi:hypothetical protein